MTARLFAGVMIQVDRKTMAGGQLADAVQRRYMLV